MTANGKLLDVLRRAEKFVEEIEDLSDEVAHDADASLLKLDLTDVIFALEQGGPKLDAYLAERIGGA